jgi:alkanesulfonate monooxygenase SsuD/methylene tetrahydromethanopterin reductase-like flavin-dependent oxidoreductase (luciferase family)
MLNLATRIADGAIWANAALSAMSRQVNIAHASTSSTFFLANMIPTVITDDRSAARAIHRKTLTGYAILPNYRNYWREAGYDEQMNQFETVIDHSSKDQLSDRLQAVMSDEWIDDCTISGTAHEVRQSFEQWRETGVLPIAVMSSTKGGQIIAVREFFDLWR